MWDWLNDNANAIEAISGILTVGVTTVLAVITARYVRLTKTPADASAQLRAQAEAAAARRRTLQADVNLLLKALDRLPSFLPNGRSKGTCANRLGGLQLRILQESRRRSQRRPRF